MNIILTQLGLEARIWRWVPIFVLVLCCTPTAIAEHVKPAEQAERASLQYEALVELTRFVTSDELFEITGKMLDQLIRED